MAHILMVELLILRRREGIYIIIRLSDCSREISKNISNQTKLISVRGFVLGNETKAIRKRADNSFNVMHLFKLIQYNRRRTNEVDITEDVELL